MRKFILEMANNHHGNMRRGMMIINEFAPLINQYPNIIFVFKFQRRALEHLIHPDADETKHPYIGKFRNTQLSLSELKRLKTYAEELGFETLCTPFDEVAVDEIMSIGFDKIKIASCSANDWPLLNHIAEQRVPVILSTGGLFKIQKRKAIEFFENRMIPLTLMACVGLYPTPPEYISLDNIKYLRETFPNLEVGLSSHAEPDNTTEAVLAAALDVQVFEKHVDVSTATCPKNAYSLSVKQVRNYIEAYHNAKKMLSTRNIISRIDQEFDKLSTFMRGAYLNRDIEQGDTFDRSALSFYMPIVDNDHIAVENCTKYTEFEAKEPLKAGSPLRWKSVILHEYSHRYQEIADFARSQLDKLIVKPMYQNRILAEVSHHYGIEQFDTTGMILVTIVNCEYCKKLLILKAWQSNPTHIHRQKKETFFVLQGTAVITTAASKEGQRTAHMLKQGQMITIEPGTWHSIAAGEENVIIEELSTNHQSNDSEYLDETINQNTSRKRKIYV